MADVAETIEESGRRIGHHVWVEARLFEVLGRWSGTVGEPRARALFGRQSRHHAWHVQLWHELLPALPHVGPSQLVAPGGPGVEMIAALEALDEPAASAAQGDRTAGDTGGATGTPGSENTGGGGGTLGSENTGGAGGTLGSHSIGAAGGTPGSHETGEASGTPGPPETDASGAGRDADRHEDPAAVVARLNAVVRDALPALERTYEEHLASTTPVTDGPTVRVLRLVLADLAEDRAAGEALLDTLTPAGPG